MGRGAKQGTATGRARVTGPSILLVDDHPIWRDSLKRLLERKKAGHVIGEATDGDEAINLARIQRPDVVIMDVDLPRIDGIEATKTVHKEAPDAKVLFLSALEGRDDVIAALRAGASGYLLKTAAPDEVVDAVRRVHAGEVVFPPALAQIVREQLQRGDDTTDRTNRRAPRDTGDSFVREGEFWTLGYANEVIRMKDSKGLRYIATLLRTPSEPLHVMELVTATEGVEPASRGRAATDDGLRGGGEVAHHTLDRQARASYRTRIDDLTAELEEAEAWNDAERATRARAEIDALTTELAKAVGVGGRGRMMSSASERARVNVARAISSALGRIEAAHPQLAEHLSRSIRTGTFCSYEPERAIAWTL